MAAKTNKIKVVYFSRKPRKVGNFSAEIYFKTVREHLDDRFEWTVVEMPFYNGGFFKRLGNALYCIFKQGDINHITGDIHFVAAFLQKKKTILTILDCGMLHHSTGLKHWLFKLFWYKIPAQKVAHITAISEATKQDVIRFTGCDPQKVSVIYVCIDPEFTPHPRVFNKEEPRILQIGTNENKNLHRLIPALKDIRCKLVILGKVNDRLQEAINENGINCEILDWRLTDEEVRQEYIKCDILSFVSILEGFGMPIVEANVVGRVVITGNTTSMPEVAGDAAHLVDPFSIENIRIGFNRILNDGVYREQLIQNGYNNCQRFSIQVICKQFEKVYSTARVAFKKSYFL